MNLEVSYMNIPPAFKFVVWVVAALLAGVAVYRVIQKKPVKVLGIGMASALVAAERLMTAASLNADPRYKLWGCIALAALVVILAFPTIFSEPFERPDYGVSMAGVGLACMIAFIAHDGIRQQRALYQESANFDQGLVGCSAIVLGGLAFAVISAIVACSKARKQRAHL